MTELSTKRSGTPIARRLVFGLGTVLLIVLAASGVSQWLVSTQVEALRLSYGQSRELTDRLGAMRLGMSDQETGERGYVLTNKPVFLEPYDTGRALYLKSVDETRRLLLVLDARTGEDFLPELNAVRESAETWHSYIKTQVIDEVRRGNFTLARQRISAGQGKNLFDRFRQKVAILGQKNDELLGKLEAINLQQQRLTETLGLGILFLAGGIGALITFGLLRDLRQPLVALETAAQSLKEGNLRARVPQEVIERNNELSLFAGTFNDMAEQLGRQTEALRERDILGDLRALDTVLVEEVTLSRMGERLLSRLLDLTGMQLGALYLVEQDRLILQAGLGSPEFEPVVAWGEGLVGLAASNGQPVILDAQGESKFALRTPAGRLVLSCLSAWPLTSNQQVVAVLFLGGLSALRPQARNLLASIGNQVAVALVNSRNAQVIAAAQARMQATFTQMSDGLFIGSVDGREPVVNPAGRRILGLDPEQDLPPDWLEQSAFFTPEGEPLGIEEQPFQRALRQGMTVRSDVQIRLASGRRVLLSVSASPLIDTQGKTEGVVAVFRDVTVERDRERRLSDQAQALELLNSELKATNDELEMQRSELEATNEEIEWQRGQIEQQNSDLLEADRQKNNFLASMSHELRTPLNAIIGFSQLLRRNVFLQEQPKILLQLERIYENGKIQLRLVNDILDLAKIKAGKLELQYAPLSVRPFVHEVVASLESLATEKNLSVRIEVEEDMVIETDRYQLRTVLANLVSNAFKYTERGEVEVSVRRLDGGSVEFRVGDTGVGIPLEQQSQVFDEFRRLEGAATRQAGGTGLGLTICRRLVTALGGTISLESTVGVGSTFAVRVPIAASAVPGSTSLDGAASIKVLLIENDPQIQQLIATRLNDRPYRLLFAPDSTEGIQIARSERPDVIVLDPTLPRMDLWKVLFELRIDPATGNTPILFQSIRGDKGLAIPLGLTDLLSRPVSQESLLAILRRRRVAQEGEAILIVDDNEDNREYLAACLRDEGYRVDLAASGFEALHYLEHSSPQLVILDLMMPRMDGFEVLRRIRRLPDGEHLPVVILSAMDLSEEQRQNLISQNAEQILKKGDQSIDDLIAHLDDTLKKRADLCR